MKVYPKVFLNKKFVCEYLSKQDLTLADFAKKLQCTTSQLSNWLNGKVAVSPKIRSKIRQLIHVSDFEWHKLFKKAVDNSDKLKIIKP